MADISKVKLLDGKTYDLKDANAVSVSTLTLTLTASGWSNGTQTITATGVTTSNMVRVDCAPSSKADCMDSNVKATTRAANKITFTCETTPTANITVYVTIYSKGGNMLIDGLPNCCEDSGTTIVAVPQVTVGTYTYSGSAQGPTITGDTSNIIITDGTKVNAGSYTMKLSLKNTATMMWADMTTADKTYDYSIGQATASITLSKTSVILNSSKTSDTVTATTTSDGTLSVSSSDTNVAKASISGSTITISSVDNASGTSTVTVSAPKTTNYKATSKAINVTGDFVKIYGVSWDGSSTTAFSRTDAAETFTNPSPAVSNGTGSSPFDNLQPWAGMERVTDSEGGVLVKIPKFYFKWTRSGSAMKLQIADGKVDGFYVSPAHADRGDGKGERDVVYVGAYHCSTSNYKSATGVKPKVSITRATARSSISALGSTIWQWDFAMLWTIQMLYLVEYADWNSQAKIGYGCSTGGSATENSGACDAMKYHTGTNAASRTTYGHTRYRYIEDLWGNVYDWCDGIYFSSANVYCIKNPASFSDTANGTLVGTRATSSNYIKSWTNPTASGFEYALYPSTVGGSETTYVPDYCYYSAGGVVLRVGGSYYQNQYHGLFYLGGSGTASDSSGYIGSRLQKLP